MVSLSNYYKNLKKDTGASENRIALIYAEGEVAFGGEQKGTISMERYEKLMTRLAKDKKVKAVVLRVNSPGGSALTSDRMWKKIEEFKDAGKFVVASFGDFAASGGYYIACGADKIVTQPTTLTGSIGVFSMIPDLSEFFENKMGINWDTISSGDHTFMYSTMVDRGAGSDRILMNETERVYEVFKQRVADGRGMSMEEVEEVAQGRVWLGELAVEVGLADEIGTLDDAIDIAAEETNLEEYKVYTYPVITKTFYEELMSELMTNAQILRPQIRGPESIYTKQIGEIFSYLKRISQTPQARFPYMLIEN